MKSVELNFFYNFRGFKPFSISVPMIKASSNFKPHMQKNLFQILRWRSQADRNKAIKIAFTNLVSNTPQ